RRAESRGAVLSLLSLVLSVLRGRGRRKGLWGREIGGFRGAGASVQETDVRWGGLAGCGWPTGGLLFSRPSRGSSKGGSGACGGRRGRPRSPPGQGLPCPTLADQRRGETVDGCIGM